MNNYAYLGIVQEGRFKPLATEQDTAPSYRLTSQPLPPQGSPEQGEVPLADYEGSAILIRGFAEGEWIYSAIIIEKAGLILTAVVQEVFDLTRKPEQYHLRYPLA